MPRDDRLGRTELMREAARQLNWPTDPARLTRDQRRMLRRLADNALRTWNRCGRVPTKKG